MPYFKRFSLLLLTITVLLILFWWRPELLVFIAGTIALLLIAVFFFAYSVIRLSTLQGFRSGKKLTMNIRRGLYEIQRDNDPISYMTRALLDTAAGSLINFSCFLFLLLVVRHFGGEVSLLNANPPPILAPEVDWLSVFLKFLGFEFVFYGVLAIALSRLKVNVSDLALKLERKMRIN